MGNEIQLQSSLKSIRKLLSKADYSFYLAITTNAGGRQDDLYYTASNCIEKAFISLLVLVDSLNLEKTYEEVKSIYNQAKNEDFLKVLQGPDEPELLWSEMIYKYVYSISDTYGIDTIANINKTIIEIIKESTYTITDTKLFKTTPQKEDDVHLRIEGILRCSYPDLKHKPVLTKAIKNFEPDTGIPSIKTLIEYKFISKEAEVKKVSDEILIDTRGYHSKDWNNFIYVIYETNRFQPESKWKLHLKECGLGENTNIVVITGEPLIPNKSLANE